MFEKLRACLLNRNIFNLYWFVVYRRWKPLVVNSYDRENRRNFHYAFLNTLKAVFWPFQNFPKNIGSVFKHAFSNIYYFQKTGNMKNKQTLIIPHTVSSFKFLGEKQRYGYEL